MNTVASREVDADRFIEDVAVFLENTGLPRSAGRIFGFLILSEEEEVSTDELVQNLHTSRGSVSTATRLLIQHDLIDRVGRKGERQDFFRLRSDTWTRLLKKRLDQIMQVHRIFERGLLLTPADDSPSRKRLLEIHEFYHFMETEWRTILERWEEYRKKKNQ